MFINSHNYPPKKCGFLRLSISTSLTKKKIVFYAADRPVSDDTYLVLDVDGDYEISGLDDGGSLKFLTEKVSYNGLPAYHITVSADNSLYKQIIKRDIVLTDRKSGRQTKALKLTVQMGKKSPAAAWKKSLVTLNASDKGDFAVNSPKYEGFSIAPLSSNHYKPKIPGEISVALINENLEHTHLAESAEVFSVFPFIFPFLPLWKKISANHYENHI